MLVPGGQSEIFTSRSFSTKVVISRRHRGFIRLAKGMVARRPIFSMGEWMAMDNVYMPKFQKLFRDLLGFPIPFVPYGSFDDTKTYPNQNSVWGAICFFKAKECRFYWELRTHRGGSCQCPRRVFSAIKGTV